MRFPIDRSPMYWGHLTRCLLLIAFMFASYYPLMYFDGRNYVFYLILLGLCWITYFLPGGFLPRTRAPYFNSSRFL